MIYQGNSLSVRWLDDGIAGLEFAADAAVNTLDTETIISLSKALDALESAPGLRGLIISSSKKEFIVGADIKEFLSLFAAPAEQVERWLQFAHKQFNRLEDLPVPVVSAINGFALGGGCELVLATDIRVLTQRAKIGLPETQLGIIPGFGGTVRLPRLIGADNALEMITTGKPLTAEKALAKGLADVVCDNEALTEVALKTLRTAIEHPQWQQRRSDKCSALKLTATEAQMSFATAQAMVQQKAGRHYPAPMAAVQVIASAAQAERSEAQRQEITAFLQLASSTTATALIGLFLNQQYVKGVARKLAADLPAPQQAAVLGAGIMGGGIAWQSASRGTPVKMKDINQQALSSGMTEATRLAQQQLERKKIRLDQVASLLTRIQPQLDYQGFDNVDIVVEAVVENPQIKGQVLQETENQVGEATILASNTSTIPISLLAQGLKRPEQFCGMHFFNPVPKMPLVEVIRGEKTSEKTIQQVVNWATQMGKTAIVVNDCPGFFVNRVLFPYFSGFSMLLRDGADYLQIDKVMEKQFGWPMGPSWLLDVVGLDTAHHAQQVMAKGFPGRMQKDWDDAVDALFEQQRFGQKNGHGFWKWSKDKRGRSQKSIDPETARQIEQRATAKQSFDDQQIIDRMMIPMINEVVRCLEEQVIASPAEADMALIYGLGFPPFRGGVFRYLDSLGNDEFVARTQRYHALGPLYQAPALLLEKAKNQQSWYPKPVAISADKLKQS